MTKGTAPRELTKAEMDYVHGGGAPVHNAGGGPGNSGPGDKNSPVEGPSDQIYPRHK
jgi:hypothetical protein